MTQTNPSIAGVSSAEYNPSPEPVVPKGLPLTIFLKELTEILRDKRTRFGAVVSPLLIVPLLVWGGGLFANQQQQRQAKKVYNVGIEGAEELPGLQQWLRKAPGVKLEITTGDAARREILSRKLNCVVVIPLNASQSVDADSTAHIALLIDSANDVSQAASARVQAAIGAYSQMLQASRLRRARLGREFGTPIAVEEQSVKGSGSPVMLLLSMLLPYFLTLNALTGGMYAANDQIAGEKERGTLETLLVSPASRRDIVTGKFCAVACVCLLSGLLSVTGMALPFVLHLPGIAGTGGSGMHLGLVHLSVAAVSTIFLAQIPLALLCAGLLIGVSTIARNQKEVQVYQTPLILAVVLPAMASISMSSDVSWRYALVPILNSGLVIKQSLAGIVDPLFLIVALGSAFLYAAVAVAISVKLFESEKVLLKT